MPEPVTEPLVWLVVGPRDRVWRTGTATMVKRFCGQTETHPALEDVYVMERITDIPVLADGQDAPMAGDLRKDK